MMYKGVEYNSLYSKDNKMFRTIGYSNDFDNSNNLNIIFVDIVSGDTYHMAKEKFESQFEKLDKYV